MITTQAMWRAVGCTAAFLACSVGLADDSPNLHEIPSDLEVPAVTGGAPRPGARVWQTTPGYEAGDVAHTLYLPTDWQADKRFPVIFEYPGNGGFRNDLGDQSDGTVEGCQLGYGLSGGTGMIWVCLPFVDVDAERHSTLWWGDPDETARYCQRTAALITEKFGGDPQRLILSGFSRGAIAGNYIGLRNDDIAKLWRGFLLHSHYDGVRRWSYSDSDTRSAHTRLARLGDRPQFVSHEMSTADVESYLERSGLPGSFTFAPLPFRNHSPSWVLKDLPIRAQARQWLSNVLKE